MENSIAGRLKRLREQHQISQMELAQAMGVNRMTINNYELGKRVPDLDFVVKAADYFSVTLEYIAGRTEYTDKEEFELLTERVDRLLRVAAHVPQSAGQQMIIDLTALLEEAVRFNVSEHILIAVTGIINEYKILLGGYDRIKNGMVRDVEELIARNISPSDAKGVCSDEIKALSDYTLDACVHLFSDLRGTTDDLQRKLKRILDDAAKKI